MDRRVVGLYAVAAVLIGVNWTAMWLVARILYSLCPA